jgi:DNA-binding NtrC family response regulator
MAYQNVLLISQASEVKRALARVLSDSGLSSVAASSIEEAHAVVHQCAPSLIFCSDELSGDSVEDFIRETTLSAQKVPIVIVLRVGDWEQCMHYLNVGAVDCVSYPVNALEVKRITEGVLSLPASPRNYGEFSHAVTA